MCSVLVPGVTESKSASYFSISGCVFTYRESNAGLVTNCFKSFQTRINANHPLIKSTTVHLCIGVAVSVASPTIQGHLKTKEGFSGWDEMVE